MFSKNGILTFKMFMIWLYLLCGRVTSVLLQQNNIWFDGFDFIISVIIPMIIILTSLPIIFDALFDFKHLANWLFYLLVIIIISNIIIKVSEFYLKLNLSFESITLLFTRGVDILYSYLIGYILGFSKDIRDKLFYSKIQLFLYIFILIIVFAGIFDVLNNADITVRVGGRHIFVYSDSIVFISVMFLSNFVLQNRYSTLFIYIIFANILLFLIGLRSNLISFNISTIIIIIFSFNAMWKNKIHRDLSPKKLCLSRGIAIFCLALIFVVLFKFNQQIWQKSIFYFSRLNLSTLSTDGSFIQRMDAMRYGLNAMKENINYIFWGNFGYEISILDTPGGYIHNILSIWAEFGLFSMIITLCLIIIELKFMFKLNSISQDVIALKWFYLHWLISFIFFRTYYTIYFWFALGWSIGLSACQNNGDLKAILAINQYK